MDEMEIPDSTAPDYERQLIVLLASMLQKMLDKEKQQATDISAIRGMLDKPRPIPMPGS